MQKLFQNPKKMGKYVGPNCKKSGTICKIQETKLQILRDISEHIHIWCHGKSMKPRTPLQQLRVILLWTPVRRPTLTCQFGIQGDMREQLRTLKDLSVDAQMLLSTTFATLAYCSHHIQVIVYCEDANFGNAYWWQMMLMFLRIDVGSLTSVANVVLT